MAFFYLFAAILHLMDILDLRLHFSEMTPGWRIWIVFLLIFDSLTALGLFFHKRWGVAFYLVVTMAQLVAYTFYSDTFGDQGLLITFHSVSLVAFIGLMMRQLMKSQQH